MAVFDIVWDDVLAMAPQLSTTTAGAQTDILDYVNELDMSGLGETDQTTRMARILLAAHWGTIILRAPGGMAGPVTSESAGALRRSYGLSATPSGEEGFGTTMYGMQYVNLLRMSLAHGPMLL